MKNSSSLYRHLPAWVAFVVLAALAFGAHATTEMPQGPLGPLTGNDAYLLVTVDTNAFLHELRIDRQGSVLGNYQVDDLGEGRSLRVLRVPAGEYRFTRLFSLPLIWKGRVRYPVTPANLPQDRYDIDSLEQSPPFHVRAGVLNYPGDVLLRFQPGRMSLSLPNRSERTLRLLRERHPGGDTIPLVYASESPDPYPTWRAAKVEQAAPDPDACPANDQLPSGMPPSSVLFAGSEVMGLSMDPTGALVLETAYRDGQYQVNVIDPASGVVSILYGGVARVTDAVWAGPRVIAVRLRHGSGVISSYIFQLGDGALGERKPVAHEMPVEGFVVDPLPGDPTALLFATVRPDHKQPAQVFRVDLTQREITERQFEPRKRINKDLDDDFGWLADATGTIRLAMIRDGDAHRLLYRSNGKGDFQPIATLDAESVFTPQALDQDGTILALTNRARAQVDLVRIDPSRPTDFETIHTVPGIDLTGVVRSEGSGDVVGVRYYEAGEARVHLFDALIRGWHEKLQASFPGRAVEFVDVNLARGRSIVVVSNDVTPPVYYFFNVSTSKAEKLRDSAPGLAGSQFVERSVMDIPAPDGRTVQALLAVPKGEGPHAVLVMPHGGPFYVQDVLGFDRDVQFWATRGFAVLQVNFRGSYGFGTAHLTGGFAGFGRAIEDDIQHAIAAVMDREKRLDPTRLCAVGASYGGYSALMLALRDPKTIRCAVAMAAPTDLPLLFTSSDWSGENATRQAMVRMVGDPRDDGLQQLSPLYLVPELAVPVMLIHGREDRRVDYEHTERMAAALHAHGKTYRAVAIDGMPHGAETVAQKTCAMGTAEQFIRKHLAGKPTQD